MCKVLKVSKSGFYKWVIAKPSQRTIRNTMLKEKIIKIYQCSKFRYGSPRIAKELNTQGILASKPLVAKLMKQEHLRSIVKKKYKTTTDSNHKYPVVDNILSREFNVAAKNKVWVSDITYIHTQTGWLYLTIVIDLYNRKVIGWALSVGLKTKDTTIPALKMATINSPIKHDEVVIFHSDRGIQYACEEFITELQKYKNIKRSMSRKGNCWDNAVAESFFKTIKSELIYHIKYTNKQEAALSIFEYIETWYNKNRRHSHLDNLTILEHEKSTIKQLKKVA